MSVCVYGVVGVCVCVCVCVCVYTRAHIFTSKCMHVHTFYT